MTDGIIVHAAIYQWIVRTIPAAFYQWPSELYDVRSIECDIKNTLELFVV